MFIPPKQVLRDIDDTLIRFDGTGTELEKTRAKVYCSGSDKRKEF